MPLTNDQLLHQWCQGRVTYQQVEDELDARDNRRPREPMGWYGVIGWLAMVALLCWAMRGN